MATDKKDRPVRVINDDTTEEELRAGHRTPNADPPTGNDARGGFGNRDGKQGYGTDSEDGSTAVSVNENADRLGHPAGNMRTTAEGRAVLGENEDMPFADDDMDDDAVDDATYGAPRRPRPAANRRSDTGPSGVRTADNGLTADGNNVRPDAPISGQGGLTFAELARQGTNADLVDPDARSSGVE